MWKGIAFASSARSESPVMITLEPGPSSGSTTARKSGATWIRPRRLSVGAEPSGSGKCTRVHCARPSGAPCRMKTDVPATGPSIRTGAEPIAIPFLSDLPLSLVSGMPAR